MGHCQGLLESLLDALDHHEKVEGFQHQFNTRMCFHSRGWLMKEGHRTVQSAISGRVQQAVQGDAQVPLHGSVRA